GIQVSGPRLNPADMNEGFHAIPAVASSSPYVPACFYEPGDYTCVKDAMLDWWNPTGQDPADTAKGCWAMTSGGHRLLSGQWPRQDLAAAKRQSDPCNTQGAPL